MAQGWQSPIGAFNQGLVGGLQLARQREQMNREAETQKLNLAFKALEVNKDIVSNKNIPTTMRQKAAQDSVNAYDFFMSKLDPNHKPLGQIGNLEEMPDFAKQAGGIVSDWKAGKLPNAHFTEAMKTLYQDIRAKEEPASAKNIFGQISPMLEQEIAAGPDMRPASPLMQAVRGIDPVRATTLEKGLGEQYTGELLGTINRPSIDESMKPAILEELSRVNPAAATKVISDIRDSNKVEGIWSDTGYLNQYGQPILRNTRSKLYSDGNSEFKTLPSTAYRKEGLKRNDEESLSGAMKTFSLLDTIDTTLSDVSIGVPNVGEKTNAVKRYLDDKQAQEFAVAADQLSMLGNEIIKGVPSNFDIELYRKTLPSPNYPYSENVKRVNKIREMLKTGFAVKIKNLRNARFPIPQDVMEVAAQLGVFDKSGNMKAAAKDSGAQAGTWEAYKKKKGL